MENLSIKQLQQQVQQLERQNRVLHKKLERAESNRMLLEDSYEIQSQQTKKIIHDLKVMQAKLVESEKMSALGVLVAGIAHEINNPMNFIHVNIGHTGSYVQSLIELLHLYQKYYPEPVSEIIEVSQDLDLEFVVDDLFKLLKSMQVGSHRIRNIVLGLRTFARLDEAEYKEVDLHEGLESTLMILQHRLMANANPQGISIVKQYEPLPNIACYAGKLNQVFMALLVNAIDAIEERQSQQRKSGNESEEGCITLRTSASEGWVEVAIADNGIGMSEEVQQQIFNPFFTTKSVGKGTGMGLAIAYQIIVELHQGQLSCYSELGKGTEFTIEIPIK
ncbi:ATP-binding protein [Oscillatoria sp. FACHB-1406]|uniref:sensor histidine kinase n=1 Tax=Oscillatoria sp. FACHB-1406 TaxID=2692846 RepID=UPI001689238C|nr:ATP-binding protein [Oscillatoria sp. FACHB-1406]MBD2579362.1 HAMP domain-containing histidine kinase [Oscillatoria sp. FACHB-1406]